MFLRDRLTDIENRLVVAGIGGMGWGGGEGWTGKLGSVVANYLYIEWINNKVLLYSTGNYIQYPEIYHNGKEYKKECVYICITESLLYSRN